MVNGHVSADGETAAGGEALLRGSTNTGGKFRKNLPRPLEPFLTVSPAAALLARPRRCRTEVGHAHTGRDPDLSLRTSLTVMSDMTSHLPNS